MTYGNCLRTARTVAISALLLVQPLTAQDSETVPAAHWRERTSLGVSAGVLRPTGNSQLYTLLDRALTPGGQLLQPRLASGTVYFAVTPTVSLAWRSALGGYTAATGSIAQPSVPTAGISQRTTLRLRVQSTLGAQFTAWRWAAPARSRVTDRLRLTLGAGAGVVSYRLSQRGTFVDATNSVAYGAAYRSSGIGPLTYAASELEMPLTRSVAVQASLRRQWGSARMSEDYSTFDRLDFGGTTAMLGVLIAPWRRATDRKTVRHERSEP